MPIVLTGSDLTIDDVVAVARANEPATLAPEATARMAATRAIVDRILERGDEVYGLNTGVGVLKRVGVPAHAETLASFNLAMVRAHRVSAGRHAPPDVARATMVCLANTLAVGAAGVRPAIVELLLERLNAGTVPTIRVLGSIGQADLAAMADLALDIAASSRSRRVKPSRSWTTTRSRRRGRRSRSPTRRDWSRRWRRPARSRWRRSARTSR